MSIKIINIKLIWNKILFNNKIFNILYFVLHRNNYTFIQKSLVLKNEIFHQYKDMDIDEEQVIEYRIMNACTMGQLEIINEYLECNYSLY